MIRRGKREKEDKVERHRTVLYSYQGVFFSTLEALHSSLESSARGIRCKTIGIAP